MLSKFTNITFDVVHNTQRYNHLVAQNLVRMREIRKTYKILVGNPLGSGHWEDQRRRLQNNIYVKRLLLFVEDEK
jgi:hypothetical protein